MPFMTRREVNIYYETKGKGFPLLLIPPGGVNSVIQFWNRAAFNPVEVFSQDYWTITTDARNAGQSSGPLDMNDPWGMYADDQIELMNNLGIDKFMVLGCCIGCSFVLKLIEKAPDRVVAAVLEQPIGVDDKNREVLSENLYREWMHSYLKKSPKADEATARAFGEKMCGGKDFVLSVSRDVVKGIKTPMVVMPGDTLDHPRVIAEELKSLAPHMEMISQWRYPSSATPAAVTELKKFLKKHTPAH
jgi:pimeloyl-ACP methyl ester carboxylesterase